MTDKIYNNFDDLDENSLLMNVLLSTLTKLASRCQPLVSRLLLVLGKIKSRKEYFHPVVEERANDFINILRHPSIATTLLESRHQTEQENHHLDEHSSLPYLTKKNR